MTIFSRNELYWGKETQKMLSTKHVIVVGIGGVGGFCAEMLARSGIGELTLIDFAKASESNINRQIIALHSTVGQNKTDLFEKRFKDINPNIKINIITDFYSEKLNKMLLDMKFDFVADAIDTMRSKVSLIELACNNHLSLISSFGAGNRIAPEKLYICDISEIKEKNAPFVSSILYQLKKRGIEKGVKVVTSSEKPYCIEKLTVSEKVMTQEDEEIEFTKIIPASTPFVASCAGIFMASYIVRELIS